MPISNNPGDIAPLSPHPSAATALPPPLKYSPLVFPPHFTSVIPFQSYSRKKTGSQKALKFQEFLIQTFPHWIFTTRESNRIDEQTLFIFLVLSGLVPSFVYKMVFT